MTPKEWALVPDAELARLRAIVARGKDVEGLEAHLNEFDRITGKRLLMSDIARAVSDYLMGRK